MPANSLRWFDANQMRNDMIPPGAHRSTRGQPADRAARSRRRMPSLGGGGNIRAKSIELVAEYATATELFAKTPMPASASFFAAAESAKTKIRSSEISLTRARWIHGIV